LNNGRFIIAVSPLPEVLQLLQLVGCGFNSLDAFSQKPSWVGTPVAEKSSAGVIGELLFLTGHI
jgi:hypothetical protein